MSLRKSTAPVRTNRRSLGLVWLPLVLAIFTQYGEAQAPDPQKTIEALKRQVASQARLLKDWGSLTRYGSENTEIPPAGPGEDRVVFLGDETTEQWGLGEEKFFPGKPYINRGIEGQTTAQMLVRFRQGVIYLKPKVVVILAGANDIAAVMGPSTHGMMIENFRTLVDLAKANGIRVVLSSILPVCDCWTNQTKRRPVGKILGANEWLEDFASKSGSVYLDYYSRLIENRRFKKELTLDGFMPNDAGYRVMAPLAEQAIALALAGN